MSRFIAVNAFSRLVPPSGTILRSAVSRTGEATQRCTLAEALLLRFRRTGDLTDLDAASGVTGVSSMSAE